jgi:uncharacterized protein
MDIETARTFYPGDPVHGFDHVLRVLRMAERLAQAEGADLEIVYAAALLHDAQQNQDNPSSGAVSHPDADQRLNHHLASADIAGQLLSNEGWPVERVAAVQHAIRSHRFRDPSEPPTSLEAQVLFDADKLDAIGTIGVARAIAYAAAAGQPAYFPPSLCFITEGQLEDGEPHSAYHEYLFKLCRLKDRMYTPSGKAIAARLHAQMVEFFEQLAAESRGDT